MPASAHRTQTGPLSRFAPAALAFSAVVALSSPVGAQSRPTPVIAGLQAGDVVRYRTRAGGQEWKTLRVTQIDSAALVGVPTKGDSARRVVPSDSLRSLELHLGKRTRAEAVGKGVGKTILFGGAGTLVMMGLATQGNDDGEIISDELAAAILGTAATAGIASLVTISSLANPGEKWQRLDLRSPRGILPVVRRSQLTGWNLGVKFKVR